MRSTSLTYASQDILSKRERHALAVERDLVAIAWLERWSTRESCGNAERAVRSEERRERVIKRSRSCESARHSCSQGTRGVQASVRRPRDSRDDAPKPGTG